MTYAELCLPRPGAPPSSTPVIGDGKLLGLSSLAGFAAKPPPYPKEATIYASIDHSARTPSQPSQLIQEPIMLKKPPLPPQPHPREVVTVRTPLIPSQESCV